MKLTLTALTILMVSHATYAIEKVDNLKFICSGTAQVIATSSAYYSPEVPPEGRSNGVPASAGFKAKLQIVDQSNGCLVLKDKYGYDLATQTIAVSVSSQASNLAEAQADAHAFIGKKLEFETIQYFGFKSGDLLPLFPTVHKESIFLKDKNDKFSGPIPVDTNKAHGVPDYASLDAKKKFELFKSSLNIYASSKSYQYYHDFHSFIVTALQVDAPSNPRLYLMATWAFLDKMRAAKHHYGFFNFENGGNGMQEGAPIAKEFNKLSHVSGTLTPPEIVDLLFVYPSLLAPYAHTENECPAVTESTVTELIQTLSVSVDRLSGAQKWELAKPLSWVVYEESDKILPGLAHNCVEGLVTPDTKKLAKELRKTLYNL